jgi:hypothetical protein
MHRVAGRVGHGIGRREGGHAVTGDDHTIDPHLGGFEPDEVAEELQVSEPARSHRPDEVVDPVVGRGVERCHADGEGRFDAEGDGPADMVVDVALRDEVLDVLVVGAEAQVLGDHPETGGVAEDASQ